jgi:tetratricopeptide (TPR) repeat protein
MVKKLILLLIALTLPASFSWAAANPWGNLKKIYFFSVSGDVFEVKKNLAQLDAQALTAGEKNGLQQKLNELGDRYYQKKDYSLAAAFYQKILSISPQNAWPIYNKLEKINKEKGKLFWNLKNVGRQLWLIGHDFNSSFLLLNTLFNVLFFSSLFLFYVTSAVMFSKYFKLAANDFILGADSRFLLKKLILLLILLLWPMAVLGGWGFYPFLFCGFLWFYFKHDERVKIKRIIGMILFFTLLNSFNLYLEKSLKSPGFQMVKKIFAGQLFSETTYNHFDNELKVMQAYAYYSQHRPDMALDVLQATGSNYKSTLKFNLLGDIYFEKENFTQSIQFYRQSLNLDDQNKVTLKNFTLALLKNNDPELFKFYSKNYPEIQVYKDKVLALQQAKLPERILWKRLLNFSWQDFHIWNLLSNVIVEFLKFPLLLAILIMAIYISLLKKFSPALGHSTFCNKCATIIKKMSIEKAHTLCDDCYQLFLIKDSIFLEAKILKEKEINRQLKFKYLIAMIFSLFIPGFYLNLKNRSNFFTYSFWIFFNIFAFSLFTALTFKNCFGTVPMFVNMIGILAVILYLAINAYSLRSDDNGF